MSIDFQSNYNKNRNNESGTAIKVDGLTGGGTRSATLIFAFL